MYVLVYNYLRKELNEFLIPVPIFAVVWGSNLKSVEFNWTLETPG